ncbi:unnamed protein product [Adineta steineri]|uniref:G-protein coupled receptors family 1 profile domain-containing protein n=1 Tax=Adineta steineri TaxID=433720 RepID=A0A815R089_9BILA|nr:unnamed protein product [Adineta steineri]CAF1470258.1 unnamed protein product [Adineta steineri]
MNTNDTLCIDISFQFLNNIECIISRIFGSIIIFISFFSILFNIRYLYWSSYHRQNHSHPNLFILSMMFSSLLVIIIIMPSIILQYLTCNHLCSLFYCQFEGFISYLNGCVHMFMLMMISIIRYDTVLRINLTKQYFKRHSYITILICWLFAFAFALPPLFNWNKYTPEGLGFHCGLNWIDRSFHSLLYLIFAFLFVYIIPLTILSILNIYIYFVIYRLLHGASTIARQSLTSLSPADSLLLERSHSSPFISVHSNNSPVYSVKLGIIKFSDLIPVTANHLRTRRMTDPFQTHHIMRLKRLKADRRFALATIFLVSEYLLSWTPYACIALLYLFHIQFIIDQRLIITICAFIAKISMIINPFIYISTIKINQLKTILYLKKCSCHRCRK